MIQKLNYFTNKSSSPKLLLLVLWIILPLALTLVSFISWNFTGMFFVGFLIVVFYHVNYCENLTFNKFILRTLILLTTWHVGALFWMFEIDKGVYGLFANLLVHLIPFVVFYCLKKTHNLSTLAFIPIWLLFEYIQNSYHFSYPWLTLGNLLSNQTYLAQWYQFTGVLGGSFWLLLISYLLFQYFFVRNKYLKSTLTIILLPPVISICLLEIKLKEESLLDTERFITYNNQYNTQNWQKDKLAFEIIKNIDTLKKYKSLIVPEQTFRGMYNKKFSSTLTNQYFRDLIDNGVVENIFLGSTGFIKKDFLVNAALVVTKDTIYGKVKKRLVPYTEFMFPKFYPYFNKKFYRGDVEDSVEQITNTLHILPIICYESVYSLFVTDKIKNASYIYILSSEHFMDNNKYGMSQYDNIIKLRAIENNRPIIKASNFGWSMAISPSGKVLDKSNEEINYFEVPVAKNNFSFYNIYGRQAILGSILFFMICTFYKPRKQS